MKEVALIHTCWLKPFADFFSARGVSMAPYCEQAGIEAIHVTSGEGWVTKHQLYVFLEALAKGQKMPEVGFVVGERITPDCLGALGEAMAAQTTVGGVIRTFCQLINRHVEGNRCWLKKGEAGEVWLFNAKSPSSHPGRQLADHAGLMSMINLARLAGGRSWYPERVCLQSSPSKAHTEIAGLRDCEVKFGKEATGYAFPIKWLLLPTDGVIATTTMGRRAPGLVEEGESLAVKLKRLLTEILGVGGLLPSASMLADLIGMSPRTLHRSLREHQTGYQTILDEVRLSQAVVLLQDTDIPVKEIATELGFSGANNFIRTFKRLKGVTPGAHRASCQSGATALGSS